MVTMNVGDTDFLEAVGKCQADNSSTDYENRFGVFGHDSSETVPGMDVRFS